MKNIKKILLGILIPFSVVIGWYYATTFTDIPSSILPSISETIQTWIELISSGQLQGDLFVSISRVVNGYLFSAILGILLGTLMGMSENMKSIFHPTVTTIRQIPIMAWIPLIILWCGIGEMSKIVIIILAAFFPIMINTLAGISSTPSGYVEVANLYNLSKWDTFKTVYLPHALPQILVGLKLGLGISWMAVVASELIAATSGIGYRMSDARNLMRSDIVIVCMIVVGLIGIIMDKGLVVLFRKLTPWENEKLGGK